MLPYAILFTVPFIISQAVVASTKRKDLHKKGVFFFYSFNEPNLWYYCSAVTQVGFSLCSQMWQGYLYPVVSSLNVLTLTLHMSVSTLFLVLQTEVHLKCIYKRQEFKIFSWRCIKCQERLHMWTGPVSTSACMTEFFLADKALTIKQP